MSRTKPAVTATRHLADAITDGLNLHALYDALQAGANPGAANKDGLTPMQAAVNRNWWQGADLLMSFGAKPPAYDGDPNGEPQLNFQTPDTSRETALTYHLKRSTWFRPVYILLANGADINLKNKNGETPLAAAVTRGWPHAAVMLATRGAWIDPENPDQNEILDRKTGATRLLCTILQGADAAAIEKMLGDGADPNKPDQFGLYPLAAAKALKWKHVADMLRSHGAKEETAELPDPNQMLPDGQPLLTYAINYQNCHENYVYALIDKGANPNTPDKEGRSAVHWAAIMGKDYIFDALQEAGGDILQETAPGSGLRPLHFACMNNSAYIAERILAQSKPEHINEPCQSTGETPLHFAAGRQGSHGLIETLLSYGAHVNARDKKGDTPVFRAVDTRELSSVRALLRGGADIAKEDTSTHLNPALFTLVNSRDHNNLDMAAQLLDHGADPNAKAHTSLNGPSVGDSLIYFAIRYSAYDLSRLLLKNGANPHGTAGGGESAAHHCLHLRNKEGLQLLLEHGFDPLRVFTYSKKWHGSEGVRVENHQESALDCARKLVEKFGQDSEYGDMLEMIEKHIAASLPKPRRKAVLTAPPRR